MTGLPWYKRDPQAFIDGVERMTLEEVGAYTLVLEHMYLRGGPIRDSATFLSSLLSVDVRVWKRLRAALIRKGKITETGDDYLTNARVEEELVAQAQTRTKRARAGKLSGASRRLKPALSQSYPDASSALAHTSALAAASLSDNITIMPLKTQDIDGTLVQQVNEQKRTDRDRDKEGDGEQVFSLSSNEEREVVSPLGKSVTDAIARYREVAKRANWVDAKGPHNASRKRRIQDRLRAHGGLDGWSEQLATAERQPFCSGVNDRGWRLDLDWLCQPANWTKIAEEKYIDTRKRRRSNGIIPNPYIQKPKSSCNL